MRAEERRESQAFTIFYIVHMVAPDFAVYILPWISEALLSHIRHAQEPSCSNLFS